MSAISKLVGEYKKANKDRVQKITELRKEIDSSHDTLYREIKLYYINHPEDNISFGEILAHFDEEKALQFTFAILHTRILRSPEVTSDFLFLLESKQSTTFYHAFRDTFHSLGDRKKLKICLSCHCISDISLNCDYMKEHLLDKYGVHPNYSLDKNYLRINQFDFENDQYVVAISIHKNHIQSLDKMTRNICYLLRDGYSNESMNILEDGKNEFGNSQLILLNKESKQTINPKIVSKGKVVFEGSRGSYPERVFEALNFISKNHWHTKDL